MINTTDKEYKSTKRIKRGKDSLRSPFRDLARWIARTWDVVVLNVIYDPADSLHPPRLQVVVEHKAHLNVFRRGTTFDPAKQAKIRDKFAELAGRRGAPSFDRKGLFVVFSAFAPLARQDADSRVTDAEVEALKARIGNPAIWEISRSFGEVTFFFFTRKQAEDHAKRGLKKVYAGLYYDLLKPHDEFGYLRRKDYAVSFDSKQNFDKNFHSSWFHYYR